MIERFHQHVDEWVEGEWHYRRQKVTTRKPLGVKQLKRRFRRSTAFRTFVLPSIKKELVGQCISALATVQPMGGPGGHVFYMDITYQHQMRVVPIRSKRGRAYKIRRWKVKAL
jgi:hypothetical protein